MKLEKIEHNHTLTNILKVGLFSILMCMPFIASLSKMVYVACNKNAYESYYGETINESENHYINSNTFELSNRYFFNSTNYDPNALVGIGVGGNNLRIVFDNVNIISNTTGVDLSNMTQMGFWKGANDSFIYLYAFDSEGNSLLSGLSSASYLLTFEFTYVSNNLDSNMLEYTNCFYYLTYNKYSYLDNAFYYANNQVWEEDIFSWVNIGIFANSLGAFIGVFGIAQNSYFNNLLTYWLVLIIIYIIIDLILGLFTLITHIISNRKVKE